MVDDLMTVIREEATAKYPQETCGVIVKVGKKSLTIACKNIAQDPIANFVMDINDYANASDLGEIVGIWHTHTELPPQPSPADKVGCNNSELPWYIVSVYKQGDEFYFDGPTETVPDDFEMPYLERPYVAGVFDCYTLAQNWFKREHGIILNDYPYFKPDGSMGYTAFVESYEKEGFIRLIDQEPKAGDLLFMQIASKDTNHCAVFIGNEMILHHSLGRLSRRDIYGGMWEKHTTHHLRHKELLNAN